MFNRFSLLPPKVKVIVLSIASVFVIAIILSIPSLVQKMTTNNNHTRFTDKHSGVIMAPSNAAPERYGSAQKSPTIIGSKNLIDHGISFSKTTQVSKVVSAYYQHKNIVDNTDIKLISISKDINHYDEGDYSVYDTTIKLDDNDNLTPLRIKDLNIPNKYHFIIQLKLGDDYQTIYETNDDISQFVQ